MKKLILFCLFGLMSICLFAQKPSMGDKQLTLGIQGINSGYMLLRHYYKDDMAKRYGVGGNGISYSNGGTVNYGFYQTKTSNFFMNSFFSYGIQKSFGGFEKVEPYIGIDYSLNVNMNKNYYKFQIIDSVPGNNNSVGDFSINRNNKPTSLRLSLKPVVGFNYYIKNFAIGVEYSLNLLYAGYSFGGSNITESQTKGVYKIDKNDYSKAFSLGSSFNENLVLTFSYFFRCKAFKKSGDNINP